MHELSIKILFIHITDKKNYCNIGMRLFNFLIISSLVYYYCIDLILFPTLLCPYPFYFSKIFSLLDSFCILCDSGNVTIVSKCDTSFFFYICTLLHSIKQIWCNLSPYWLGEVIWLVTNMLSYCVIWIWPAQPINYLMYFLHLV